jgi:excisionase family DNA binding protein
MVTDRTTPAVYSIAEACAVAGIRRTTLYKEIRSGALRAVKIGGRTVILTNDLRRWLDCRPAIIPEPLQSGS